MKRSTFNRGVRAGIAASAAAVFLATAISALPAAPADAASTADSNFTLKPFTYEQKVGDSSTTKTLNQFTYDGVKYNMITPVKDQTPWSTCWGFSTIAAVESTIAAEKLMIGDTAAFDENNNNKLDLSERQLAWFGKTALNVDKDGEYGRYASQNGEGAYSVAGSYPLATGGTLTLSAAIFGAGTGPIEESDAPYQPKNAEENIVQTALQDNAGMYRAFDDEQAAAGFELKKTHVVSSEAEASKVDSYYAQGADWSVASTLRFKQLYELVDSEVLPSPANPDHVLTEVEEATGAKAKYVYNASANDVIKETLLQGSAVAVNVLADQSQPGEVTTGANMNMTNWAHYTYREADGEPIFVTPNHGVTIVGWDDEYPKENFAIEGGRPTPKNDGAWLVKNSWGAGTEEFPNFGSWGIDEDGDGFGDGYFWISYEDQSLSKPETYHFDITKKNHEDAIVNQYDFNASTGYAEDPTDFVVKQANVFTADTTQKVRSLSFATASQDQTVTFKVVKLNESANNPEDGTTVFEDSLSFENAGYHRYDLMDNEAIPILKGEKFAVVITSQGEDGKYYPSVGIAGSEASSDIMPAYTKAVVNEGETFIYAENAAESYVDADGWAHAITAGHTGEWIDFGTEGEEGVKTILKSIGMDMGGVHTGAYVAYDNFPIKAYADTFVADLSNAVVTAPDQPYSGEECKPAPTVTIDGIVIDPQYYDVSYENNVDITGDKPATVTVTGKNGFTGSASGNFNIIPVEATLSFALDGGTYNGSTNDFAINAIVGETITIPEAPTKDGYTFQYWEGSEYYPGDEYKVEGDHAFTAKWTETGAAPSENSTVSTGDKISAMLLAAAIVALASAGIAIGLHIRRRGA